MTEVVPTKMTIAYGNAIDPANISSVTYGGNVTPVTGFSADNLQYPDPGRLFKFNVTPSDPTADININFSPALTSVNCVGLLRHNLNSANSWGAAPYLDVEIPATTHQATMTIRGDTDTLVLFDSVGSVSQVTFELNWPGGAPNAVNHIGSVFVGTSYQELVTNPTDGLLEVSTESAIAIQESSGGSRHFLSLGDRDRTDMSFETRRAREADAKFFGRDINEDGNRHKMIGVIYPWETQAVGVTDMPHFFGYIEKVRIKPRASAATDRRFDLAVDFIGA